MLIIASDIIDAAERTCGLTDRYRQPLVRSRRHRPASSWDFLAGRCSGSFDKRRVFGEQASHLSLVSRRRPNTIVCVTNEELIEPARYARSRTRCLRHVARRVAAPSSFVRSAPRFRSRRASRRVRRHETDVPGLFLAGDWIDTGLPATIEGEQFAAATWPLRWALTN